MRRRNGQNNAVHYRVGHVRHKQGKDLSIDNALVCKEYSLLLRDLVDWRCGAIEYRKQNLLDDAASCDMEAAAAKTALVEFICTAL